MASCFLTIPEPIGSGISICSVRNKVTKNLGVIHNFR